MDIQAIIKAYPNASYVDETTVKDASGNVITTEQSKIDTARTAIDAEYAALEYSRNRAAEYPSVVDQLDNIYHNGIDAWKATIKVTKDKYPKP